MDVFLANEQDLSVDEARLSSLARHVLVAEEIDDSAELSILCVTRDHIRELNMRFAGNDYATDVLAFPMGDDDEGELILGDVIICPRVAEENATQIGRSLDQELETLLVHGTLHLLGYDHDGKEDRSRMDNRLLEVLRSFGESET
ncbi:MAG: rRNA maturation RNase YbeY [Actinomycetota bacterium]|nr:rRNA maturation RNase YbeY [Actinomycetota bacterium]